MDCDFPRSRVSDHALSLQKSESAHSSDERKISWWWDSRATVVKTCCDTGPSWRRTPRPAKRLALSAQGGKSAEKRRNRKCDETDRLECDARRISKADRRESHDVHVPGDRVRQRRRSKSGGKRIDRIEHRAGEEEDEIENRR